MRSTELTSSRLLNPLLAVHSAPGGGKSFFLDQLANKNFGIRMESDLQEYLNSLLALSVTYNGHQNFIEDREKSYLQGGLALRILHRYFFARTDWGVFLGAFLDTLPFLDIDNAKECVLWCHRNGFALGDGLPKRKGFPKTTGFLLLIDEYVKIVPAVGQDNAIKLLSSACQNLDHDKNFWMVVSTLDIMLVSKTQSSSGRPIRWMKMTPLTGSRLISHQQYQKLDAKTVDLLTSDCGGHPRSLEYLAEILKKATTNNYATLLDNLGTRLRISYPKFFDTASLNIEALLKPALLNQEISILDTTNAEYIQHGVYFNSLVREEDKFVPWIPPIFLRLYTMQNTNYFADRLKEIFASDSSHSLSSRFESFHASWEALCLTLRGKNNSASIFSLQDHYRGLAIHKPSFDPTTVKLNIPGDINIGVFISDKYIPAYKFHQERLEKKFIQLNTDLEKLKMKLKLAEHDKDRDRIQENILEIESQLTQITKERQIQPLTPNTVILTRKHDNPGHDMVYRLKSDLNTDVYINVQCKFSSTEKKKLGLQDVEESHKNSIESYNTYFERLGIQPNLTNIYSVFACHRETTESLVKNQHEIPTSVLVMNRDALMKLYGPSLNSRYEYYYNHQKEG